MAPYRIVHIIKNLPFDGGTTQYLYQLLSSLDRAAFAPEILVIEEEAPGRSFAAAFQALSIPVTSLPTRSNLDLRAVRPVVQWLAGRRADLVQTHLARAHIYGGLAAWRLGLPTIMTEHGIVRNTSLPVRVWDNFYGRTAARIVCNSQATCRQVARDMPLLPRAKLAVIYPGVSDHPANQQPTLTRAALGLSDDDLLLGYVGTFMPVRCHAMLLQAFAHVRQAEPRARLLLIGDGPLQAQVQDQVRRMGLQDDVWVWPARDDIRQLLPLLDGYVNSASAEAFGIATVEAMLAALPIAVTDGGALPELIEHEVSGLVAPANDAIALAAALRRLLSGEAQAQRWGQVARQRALQQFAPAAFAGSYASLYRAILEPGRTSARALAADERIVPAPTRGDPPALPPGRSVASGASVSKPTLLVAGPTPPPYAGVETFTQTVVTSPLMQQRFALTFCNMQKPITNEQRGRLGFVNIRYNLAHLWQFLQMCRRLHPDLAYLPLSQNRPGFFRDSILLWLCRPFARRVVYQVHGGSFDRFYAGQPAWFRAYIRRVFQQTDAFLVGGERLKQQFDNLVTPAKFRVAAYGVATRYPPRSRPPDDDLAEIRVIFMGHISFAKGAVDLVRALPLALPQMQVGLRVQLAGEFINKERNITFIPEHDHAAGAIRQVIQEHRLEETVKFLGVIRDEQKLQTLVDSDIFILPSYTEAIGLSVMEAMAAQLPVIVTAAGALPDMLTEGTHCLFVKPGDPSGLAQQLVRLCADRALRLRMGQANRSIIEERYNETAFLNRLANALEDVL
ncbi:glycosyltransferase [Candidatus Amarolinea dominans]|uniref:glycosyltransferase n=1 Tax=Candidatus Amarolinea dominans TaxID=3140696 RepID=UPI001DDF7426|nr:glycosyltransferase [Anaerolineae bacterium]MBK7202664.1 glycosyltransferase [Anaerolineae bacterium]